MTTKKTASRKRVTKSVATKKPTRSTRPAKTNREILEKAGVIRHGYVFSPRDSAAIDDLSRTEVKVLIEVFNDLGEEMLEKNSPHGIVF
jgi:hypothetical protein